MAQCTRTDFAQIDSLVARWHITAWDVLLVGDGSGSGLSRPAGWGCVLIEHATMKRQKFFGGMNLGSSALAELLPYVQALCWYDARRKRLGQQGFCQVHAVTDSLSLAQTGERLRSGQKGLLDVQANQPFWAAVRAFEPLGYSVCWHHIPRASVALNEWGDRMSKLCFQAMCAMPLPQHKHGGEISIYHLNPEAGCAQKPFEFAKPPRRKTARNRSCRTTQGA